MQCPWGWETQSWSMSLPSRANTKSRAVGKTEYVVEQQPYLNLPVYVVHPMDGEGCSHTMHWNFLLSISHNLGQDECGNAVEGDGCNEPAQVSHEKDALPANSPTESQLKGTPCSPSKQCELVNQEPTRSTSWDSTDEGLQANNDMPGPLRQSSRKVRNQLPLRYWNFAAWQNDTPPSTIDLWVGLSICLYILSCLQTVFVRWTVWKHSTQTITGLPDTNDPWHGWGYHWCWLWWNFWLGGVDQSTFVLNTTAQLGKPKDSP